jgi:hypothetical protein
VKLILTDYYHMPDMIGYDLLEDVNFESRSIM